MPNKQQSREKQQILHELTGTISALMEASGVLREKAMAEGVLSRKEKELIALGVILAGGCEASIAYHVHNALEAGATRDELAEAVGVTLFTAGESTHVHGLQLLKALIREGDPFPKHKRGQALYPYMSPD